MKLYVDPERCQGHTLCAMRAPELFTLDDIDGHSTAIDGEVPSLLRAGAALGFTVIALDRPGYGASAPLRRPDAGCRGPAGPRLRRDR